jgi:phosphocarrier protein
VRRFQSKVKIAYGDREDDAGEILNLMSLGVPQGEEVTFSAKGPDAEGVLEALVQLFADDFGFHD